MLTSVADYLSQFRLESPLAPVRDRVQEMSKLSFEEASQLPEISESKFRIGRRNYSWIEWRDQLPSGDQQVVVQVWRRGWLGTSRQLARDGVVVSPSGANRPLTSQEWDAFD